MTQPILTPALVNALNKAAENPQAASEAERTKLDSVIQAMTKAMELYAQVIPEDESTSSPKPAKMAIPATGPRKRICCNCGKQIRQYEFYAFKETRR